MSWYQYHELIATMSKVQVNPAFGDRKSPSGQRCISYPMNHIAGSIPTKVRKVPQDLRSRPCFILCSYPPDRRSSWAFMKTLTDAATPFLAVSMMRRSRGHVWYSRWRVELANRFTRAVAVGNPREFTQAEKEEQEIAEACNRLIKNSIICWNYLYLARQLEKAPDAEIREALLRAIANYAPMA